MIHVHSQRTKDLLFLVSDFNRLVKWHIKSFALFILCEVMYGVVNQRSTRKQLFANTKLKKRKRKNCKSDHPNSAYVGAIWHGVLVLDSIGCPTGKQNHGLTAPCQKSNLIV